ncbi:MAG: alpha/beta fold hydrolase [Gemmatimonadaceae bacterium]
MTARFFGRSGHSLFGVYHAPTGAITRSVGVVLCYPGPQEYRHCHFIYRTLAMALAADGFPVLRFDYFGTGDSGGETRDGTLAHWVEDIRDAVSELRDLAGVRRVSLVGIRLGAALAARACATKLPVTQLVLWDPVVSGSDYLAQLDDLQEHVLAATHYPEDNHRAPGELLGYVMTDAMRASLVELDMRSEPWGSPQHVVVMCATQRPEYQTLFEVAGARGLDCTVDHVSDATLSDSDRLSDMLLASHIPAAICGHLSRRKT